MKGVDYTGIDIIITHYKAPWEVGKPLFDSIAEQRGVDFHDVGVILVNDGEESKLPGDLFDGYPYRVEQITISHSGVSTARNTGIDTAEREYCMICDFDDAFLNMYGLYYIMQACDGKNDLVVGNFVEEVWQDGKLHLIEHKDDRVYIHGKAYRTAWLRDKKLRFDPEVCLHEDVYFEMLCRTEAEYSQTMARVNNAVYLWKWYEGSVTRKTENFTLSTYDELMKSRVALIEELKRRGFRDQVKLFVAKTVMDAYYDSQKNVLCVPENAELLGILEKSFAKFFRRYVDVYRKTDPQFLAAVASGARELAFMDGLWMEHLTFAQWVDHLMKDVKAD